MDTAKFMKTIGWYDVAVGAPTHDPIPNRIEGAEVSEEELAQSLCAACEQPLVQPIQTISIRYTEGFVRSYFYRVHKGCGTDLQLDDKIWNMIEEHAMERRRVQ